MKNVTSLYLFLHSFSPTLFSAYLNGKRQNLDYIYLPEWVVELHDVDISVLQAGLLGARHRQHAASVVPLDTNNTHVCVDENRIWSKRRKEAVVVKHLA